MIQGVVTDDGTPLVVLTVAGQDWPAVIDTGFNGDLELPEVLRSGVNPRYWAESFSELAAGQHIVEELFLVDFPFDGESIQAETTFARVAEILIGTHLLRSHRLEIHFVNRTVLLERVV